MMASTATEKKRYTYEDYLKTPGDVRYELIEGDLLMTPSLVPRHQRISRELGFELLSFIRAKDPGEIFYAPCDVYLDDENVVQPDILFISKERLSNVFALHKGFGNGDTLESPFLKGLKIDLRRIF